VGHTHGNIHIITGADTAASRPLRGLSPGPGSKASCLVLIRERFVSQPFHFAPEHVFTT